MTIDNEFLEMMATEVAIKRYLGEDQFGNNTYGPSETIQCRAEGLIGTMEVTTDNVNTSVAVLGRSVNLITDFTSPPFNERDQAIIVATGESYSVLSVTVEWDENGPYYQSLVCKNNSE